MAAGSVYVYYRVADPVAAGRLARALLADVASRTGVHGVLQRRAEDSATWMEVFAAVADLDAFLGILAECEQRAGIDAALQGGRHRECFIPLDTAAAPG